MVPETNTISPSRAPDLVITPSSPASPNRVSDSVSGPGVATISPPTRATPKAPRSSPRPAEKASSQSSSTSFGRARTRRQAWGTAPMAARSERLTRNSFLAMSSGDSFSGKCTPATRASAVTTRRAPAVSKRAASLVSPGAPSPALARGAKKREIRSNSLPSVL